MMRTLLARFGLQRSVRAVYISTVLGVASLSLLPAGAQQPKQVSPPVNQTAPDALIIVVPGTESASAADVSITFPKAVSQAQVASRIARLASAGGWNYSKPSIRENQMSTDGLHGPTISLGRQTTASTRLSGPLLMQQRGFLLQPFVQSLRDLDRVEIWYFVGKWPEFQGLRNYADGQVSIRLLRDHGPYRYDVVNLDHTAFTAHLPLTQSIDSSTSSLQEKKPRESTALATYNFRKMVGLVLFVSAMCGLVVYLVIRRLTRQKPRQVRLGSR
jgi:hypothetical protein